MQKFTNRILPETQYRGHHDKHTISAHTRQGEGEEVWRTMSKRSMRGNPEQYFEEKKMKLISSAGKMSSYWMISSVHTFSSCIMETC